MEAFNTIFQLAGDWLDRLLDKLTTYRLVLYLLIIYASAAVGLSFLHRVAFSPRQIIISVVWILVISRLTNKLLAKFFHVPANQESDLITGLILALILNPIVTSNDYITLAAATVAAIVSKYVITYRGRHIFNPAAFGATVSILVFNTYASWWVGTKPMFPFLVIGGLLVLRKMKRFLMAGAFVYIYALITVLTSPTGHVMSNLEVGLEATSLLFFAAVMLTEPLTSPTMLNKSLLYAGVVGLLYSVGRLHFAPEEALLVGNLITYLMSPNRSQVLEFVGQRKEADQIYSYLFRTKRPLSFKPGQYMEWTLPGVTVDRRGNRRYLTIASSPTEQEIMLTVKLPEKASGFKTALAKMKPGDKILAAQLAGDFTLPKKTDSKLAFIAGGVGITPFRSMVKYLMDSGGAPDTKLIYTAAKENELAFRELFKDAKNVGIDTCYVVTDPSGNWSGLSGQIDARIIQTALPDFYERTFYISGPQGFVAAVRQTLTAMGVKHARIITDFFPGYN